MEEDVITPIVNEEKTSSAWLGDQDGYSGAAC